jgi:hypothetical protein
MWDGYQRKKKNKREDKEVSLAEIFLTGSPWGRGRHKEGTGE